MDISTLIFQCVRACESERALQSWQCELTRSVYIYIDIYAQRASANIENIHVLQRIHQFTLAGGHWVLTLSSL